MRDPSIVTVIILDKSNNIGILWNNSNLPKPNFPSYPIWKQLLESKSVRWKTRTLFQPCSIKTSNFQVLSNCVSKPIETFSNAICTKLNILLSLYLIQNMHSIVVHIDSKKYNIVCIKGYEWGGISCWLKCDVKLEY